MSKVCPKGPSSNEMRGYVGASARPSGGPDIRDAGGGFDQILSAPFTAGETLTLPARDALICDVSAPAPMGKGKLDATVTITLEGGSTPIGTAVTDEDGDSRPRLLVSAAAGDDLFVGQADAGGDLSAPRSVTTPDLHRAN